MVQFSNYYLSQRKDKNSIEIIKLDFPQAILSLSKKDLFDCHNFEELDNLMFRTLDNGEYSDSRFKWIDEEYITPGEFERTSFNFNCFMEVMIETDSYVVKDYSPNFSIDALMIFARERREALVEGFKQRGMKKGSPYQNEGIMELFDTIESFDIDHREAIKYMNEVIDDIFNREGDMRHFLFGESVEESYDIEKARKIFGKQLGVLELKPTGFENRVVPDLDRESILNFISYLVNKLK